MNPQVSIVIPCYNEAETIGSLLDAIARQDVGRSRLEVIVADGMSEDATRDVIARFAGRWPDLELRVIDNPTRTIPSALNRAVQAARWEVVVRLDAHSVPADDYVRRCLEALATSSAANVGGRWEIRPSAPGAVARAIAAAGSHPLGAGDARYRIGGRAGPVETVPFGAFPRAWLERVGGYEESLLTNEDYELNLRLRRAGGIVWFDPAIHSVYFARSTIAALARQYLRYGYWKGRVLLRHPRSLRWRQAGPPLFVLLTAALAALSLGVPLAGWLLALQWAAYAAIVVGSGLAAGWRSRDAQLTWGLPLCLLTIHLAWGGGFWWGTLTGVAETRRERKSS